MSEEPSNRFSRFKNGFGPSRLSRSYLQQHIYSPRSSTIATPIEAQNLLLEMDERFSAPSPQSPRATVLPTRRRPSIRWHDAHDSNANNSSKTGQGAYFETLPIHHESESIAAPPSPTRPTNVRNTLFFLKPPPMSKEQWRQSRAANRNSRRPSSFQRRKSSYRQSMYAYIEFASLAVGSMIGLSESAVVQVPDPKHQKLNRGKTSWWKNWSTRKIILITALILLLIIMGIGLALGLGARRNANLAKKVAKWRPAIGSTLQIQLDNPVTTPSLRASVYDIDLFQNDALTISNLHFLGRRVICYFSAGTYESGTADASKFTADMLGNNVTDAPESQHWLDIRKTSVRDIMAARVVLARDKGCDGIDPGDVNGYESGKASFPLTVADGVNYVRYLADLAHSSEMSIGLKNSPELINETIDVVDWQLIEGCAKSNTCTTFQPFIQAGKPVFQIEYLSNTISQTLSQACNANGTRGFSTLIKKSDLGRWAMNCPIISTT